MAATRRLFPVSRTTRGKREAGDEDMSAKVKDSTNGWVTPTTEHYWECEECAQRGVTGKSFSAAYRDAVQHNDRMHSGNWREIVSTMSVPARP